MLEAYETLTSVPMYVMSCNTVLQRCFDALILKRNGTAIHHNAAECSIDLGNGQSKQVGCTQDECRWTGIMMMNAARSDTLMKQ